MNKICNICEITGRSYEGKVYYLTEEELKFFSKMTKKEILRLIAASVCSLGLGLLIQWISIHWSELSYFMKIIFLVTCFSWGILVLTECFYCGIKRWRDFLLSKGGK